MCFHLRARVVDSSSCGLVHALTWPRAMHIFIVSDSVKAKRKIYISISVFSLETLRPPPLRLRAPVDVERHDARVPRRPDTSAPRARRDRERCGPRVCVLTRRGGGAGAGVRGSRGRGPGGGGRRAATAWRAPLSTRRRSRAGTTCSRAHQRGLGRLLAGGDALPGRAGAGAERRHRHRARERDVVDVVLTSYHGQLLSLAVQWGVAIEIERAIIQEERACFC